MNEPQDISSEQLARYVAGEADQAERTRVERWAAAAPEHRRELDAMIAIWSMGGDAQPEVDVDAAWLKVRSRITEGAERGRVITLWRTAGARWAAAAAVLIGLFFLSRTLGSPDQELVATAAPITATLMDSSAVVLAPNSRLEARMGEERHIALEGKAWFEVKRDVAHPFVVECGELRVTVLGTGFEVNAYDTAGSWSVRVRHGRVRVEAKNDTIELGAGERLTFERKTATLQRGAPVTAEAWGDRILQFQNAQLSEVAAELERIYHVRVELKNDALARCRLTATFADEPIDQVLRVIASTFGITVTTVAADRYQLDGDGC